MMIRWRVIPDGTWDPARPVSYSRRPARNNFSTLLSQLVDSLMVVTVTFGAAFLAGDIATSTLLTLVGSNYAFKAICALIDTIPLYGAVHWLRGYLQLAPGEYAIEQPS